MADINCTADPLRIDERTPKNSSVTVDRVDMFDIENSFKYKRYCEMI
jgi:hypothetical protein